MMETDGQSSLKNGTAIGIAALLGWSLSALMAVNTGLVPPLQTAAFEFSIAAFLLLLIYMRHPAQLKAAIRQPAAVYVWGITGIGLYTVLYLAGLRLAPPFEANALNYIWPLLLGAGIAIGKKAPLRMSQKAALACGFLGILFLLGDMQGGGDTAGYPLRAVGWGCSILAAVLWVGYSLKTRSMDYPPSAMVFILAASGMVVLVLHLFLEPATRIQATQGFWLFMLGATSCGYWAWDVGMKRGNPVLLASLAYCVPLLSQIALAATGHMPLSSNTMLSAALIFTGCILANWRGLTNLVKPWNRNAGK